MSSDASALLTSAAGGFAEEMKNNKQRALC
jgi:hypothetical protein